MIKRLSEYLCQRKIDKLTTQMEKKLIKVADIIRSRYITSELDKTVLDILSIYHQLKRIAEERGKTDALKYLDDVLKNVKNYVYKLVSDDVRQHLDKLENPTNSIRLKYRLLSLAEKVYDGLYSIYNKVTSSLSRIDFKGGIGYAVDSFINTAWMLTGF